MKTEYSELFFPYFKGCRPPRIPENRPLVSILMPYYNNAAYVFDSIDSIIEQTYENWELIFVDDCSPDKYARRVSGNYDDKRITYLKTESNSGAAAARNLAFAQSRGEYVLCFDPDDIMHPDCLSYLMQEALSVRDPDIVMQDILCFGGINQIWREEVKTEKDLTLNNWITGSALSKRSIWESTGGQSVSPELRYGSQDWEFWLRAFRKSDHPIIVGHVKLPIALYRRHGNSTSSKSELYAYIVRKYIHDAHKPLFDRHKTGGKFLANGYMKSIHANMVHGRIGEAFRIFFMSLCRVPAFDLMPCVISLMRRITISIFRRYVLRQRL